MKLLDAIAWCCLENGWGETRFGREFNGDPNFVRELRGRVRSRRKSKGGRALTAATRKKLVEFINANTKAMKVAA